MLVAALRSEVRNLMREKMTAFMLLYPFLLGGLGRWLFEAEVVGGQVLGVLAAMLAILTGFAYGAAAGFSLLDDRDDQVLISIQISPVPVQLYLWIKVGLLTLAAVLGGFFVIWVIGAVELSALDMLLVAAVSALQVPFAAFLINAFAHNKVEGFMTMKGSGFLLLLPVAAFFFLDGKEWLFAIAPGHWPAKAVQAALLAPQLEAGLVTMQLTFYQYLGVGLLYNLALIAGTYALFQRKNQV